MPVPKSTVAAAVSVSSAAADEVVPLGSKQTGVRDDQAEARSCIGAEPPAGPVALVHPPRLQAPCGPWHPQGQCYRTLPTHAPRAPRTPPAKTRVLEHRASARKSAGPPHTWAAARTMPSPRNCRPRNPELRAARYRLSRDALGESGRASIGSGPWRGQGRHRGAGGLGSRQPAEQGRPAQRPAAGFVTGGGAVTGAATATTYRNHSRSCAACRARVGHAAWRAGWRGAAQGQDR